MNAKAATAPKNGTTEEKQAKDGVVTSDPQLQKEKEMNKNTKSLSFIVPLNEDELIERLKYFKANEDITTVRNYYAMGQMIHAVYKKKYGKDKQQKLVPR
jgi:hypothetical protein